MIRVAAVAFIATAIMSFASPASAQPAKTCKPGYAGKLLLTPDANGRSMTLQAPFAFRDRACTEWKVPKGAAVDGASIPRALWSIIGGPWEGAYRQASVVHDWFCAVRTRPWRNVHQMFFDAMITSGVGAKKAKIMYLAVYYGGPRWDDLAIRNSRLIADSMRRVNPGVLQALSAGHGSFAQGQLAAAEAQLATAETQMQTNGDQFAVAAFARSIALSKENNAAATAALDAMISSGVAEGNTLASLQTERARVAYGEGDLSTAAAYAREALQGTSDEKALSLVAELKRNGAAALESDGEDEFEPNALEFQRLMNIVEKEDLTPDEIIKLVDEVRKPAE